jgi:hypothetical protein
MSLKLRIRLYYYIILYEPEASVNITRKPLAYTLCSPKIMAAYNNTEEHAFEGVSKLFCVSII